MAVLITIGCGTGEPAPTPTPQTPSGADRASTAEDRTRRETGPTPSMGICERSPTTRAAIARAIPNAPCGEVTEIQLAGIEAIALEGSLPLPGDLEGMTGLRRLEIREITTPITRDSLREARQVQVLSILIGKPGEEDEIPKATLEDSALRDMKRLEELTVRGRDGWTEQVLTGTTLEGLGKLKRIRMDYLDRVDPAAFRNNPRLREISLHGTRREDETHPRIHRGTFAGLDRLRSVEIRNFRWPPVLDVKNEAVACSATRWVSFKNNILDGRRPLSVRIEGPHNRPKDVESMLGCLDNP